MDEKAPRVLGEPVKKQTSNPEALLAPGQFSKIYHSESFKPERNDEMKSTKKLLALLLVAMMIVAMLPNALAATVTIPSDGILSGHSFTAYQIFAGNESEGALQNVVWGSGIDSDAFLAALKADTTYGSFFSTCADAAAVAKVLTDNNTNGGLANAFAKLAHANKTGTGTALTVGTTDLPGGYYLIVDTTNDVGEGGAYNASLLQVVGDIRIDVKTAAPSVEKKVLEDDKYNQDGGYGTGYNDVADYNIGEAVTFHLIGLVPDMSRYDTYKYIFHDTLSAGLTLNEGSIKVYVASDKAGTDKAEITTGWTRGTPAAGESFTVSFDDLKIVSGVTQGKYIIVEYTATLNANAEIGLPGNPNTVYLQYSNKPNQSAAGDTDNTGNTPKDKVIVFTYELDTTKVDGQNTETKLKDAKFVLLNAGKNQVAKVGANNKLVGWETVDPENVTTWPAGSELTSDGNGLFKVIGLDAGTYKLREIAAPAGYNLLSQDVEVVITAGTENNQSWNGTPSEALKTLAVTANGTAGTGNPDAGIASITIANNKGNTLPETGGIGTTVFYVLGSILVIGAVVLLVSKKRMNAIE